jgi:ABC-type transport system involved in cytochrome c biogenesis permease subunit
MAIQNMVTLKKNRLWLTLLTLLVTSVASIMPLTTVSAQDIQLHDFRYIPVFHKGRIKPLDSYANEIIEVIANTTRGSVTLDMADYFTSQELASDKLKDVRILFPKTGDDEFKRTWPASELVLSWLVEPEKWEHVPFIYATHEDVRSKLDVEIENGVRKYVSPAQIKNSSSLQAWLTESAEQQRSGTDPDDEFFKHIETVLGRLDLFRSVSLQADDPLTGNIRIAAIGDRKQFCSSVQKIVRLLDTPGERGSLSERLRNLANVFGKAAASPEGPLATGQRLAASINNSITYAYHLQLKSAVILGFEVPSDEGSQAVVAADEMTTEKIAEIVFLFRANIQTMQQSFRQVQDEFSKSPQGLNATQLKDFQSMFREMQSQSLKLNVLCLELQSALYAGREAVLVIPTSNPYAVAKNRDEGTIIQPWISLQAILHGQGADTKQPTGGILSGLSAHEQILQVRRDWDAVVSTYRNRENSNRTSDFSAAQTALLKSLNKLGRRATSARDKTVRANLQASQQDPDMLSYTAYPIEQAAERIAAEIKYNDSKPFQYTAIFNLLALIGFVLSFGKESTKKLGLYFGVTFLFIGLGWTIYGFYLRIAITNWAPVTNMYETIVFVPFIVSLLAAWFLIQPVINQGLRDAWRSTAAPFLKNIRFLNEARELTKIQSDRLAKNTWQKLGYLNTAFRIALILWLFYFLTITTYGDGGTSYFTLQPDDWTSLNKVGVWAIGTFVLLLILWIIPRFLLATAISPIFIVSDFLQRRGNAAASQAAFKEMHKRRFFGIGGTVMAGVGGLVLLLGNNLPAADQIISDNFSPLQPVLRSNFWLTIHVLTIVASYGAGGLALGLGNIALCYYIFGKYRPAAAAADVPAEILASEKSGETSSTIRPPEQCAALANYCYRCIQVAVLLLATGTILGGLWADVSWGRFWGWDPKEVWALISLLIYLAFLHARQAGWLNNFGMVAATIFGFTMIMMSWVGVNFGLPLLSDTGSVGLHSYGAGNNAASAIGGVVLIVSLNWVFLFVAWVRYKAGISA